MAAAVATLEVVLKRKKGKFVILVRIEGADMAFFNKV
jgi:hypothetical protein